MRKKLFFILFSLLFLFAGYPVHAQQPVEQQQSYVKGKVVQVVKEGVTQAAGVSNLYQTLKVQLLEGNEKGKIVTIQYGGEIALNVNQKVKDGSIVIVDIAKIPDKPETYSIYDLYRLNWGIIITVSFFVLIILLAGKKGVGAVLGLMISLFVILQFIVPEVLAGNNPLFITILWSCVILLVTTYLAHGISKATTLAIASTFIALIATMLLSILFVNIAHLAGLGSEDAVNLQFGQGLHVDLRGLLLSGIIVGTLGALNDITTTQVATIFALAKTGTYKSKLLLAEHGFSVGVEHIVSLVNTLVLAYAGSSLVMFIFLFLNPNNVPYWVILNSESLMEELVRTVSGSFGLLLAVPLATFFASMFAPKLIPSGKSD